MKYPSCTNPGCDLFTVVFFLLFAYFGEAQTNERDRIDSLKNALANANTDQRRVEIHAALANFWLKSGAHMTNVIPEVAV